ncbi:hypothetical protein [Candidatus Accumulibacter sp. ACC005]|jgi:hypothetical protein|uniref:hypothetical protein n=1 Tax=Candidatus Accumulibacter sp. ACC005 TaxID=2823331 RepID=UPI0025C58058|nr:hypothetical protein [Candidatus Accumulibacter sp. ACC005]
MARQVRLKLEMDGQWDIEDLTDLSHALRLSYSYFYWISDDSGLAPPRVQSMFARYFWSGEYIGERFAHNLYNEIPDDSRLQLVSIRYSSPGFIELAGLFGVILLLARCCKAWLEVAEKAGDLYGKVMKFFDERKLKRIPKKVDVDIVEPRDIDDARALCFEYGSFLGFTTNHIEYLIDLTGNPISALRLLVALSSEARRMISLEQQGKLKFPSSIKEPPM